MALAQLTMILVGSVLLGWLMVGATFRFHFASCILQLAAASPANRKRPRKAPNAGVMMD